MIRMRQRLKVLISAYACRPGEGSEPSIGWETVRQANQNHDIWVLTRANNCSSLEAELSKLSVPGLHIEYVDLPGWARGWRKGQIGVQLHYYIWQILAYIRARHLHKSVKFDLVHHVTYVKYWSPSFLSLLPIPFLWGPVGGGEECPLAFRKTFSWRGQLYELLRDAARWIAERDPFAAMTAKRSLLARASTEETAVRLRRMGAHQVEVCSQVGMSAQQVAELSQFQKTQPDSIRFLSIGRLLHWKGFHLGLQAFALAKPTLPTNAEYWLIGDGVEKVRLQTLVKDLGIDEAVHFRGKLTRQETLKSLEGCFALVHPSLHESGGMVVMEAMAAGCPVICLDLGGPAVQVTNKSGFKISAQSPDQAINNIAQAMVAIAWDPELKIQMGCEGRKLVQEHYSWETKGEELSHLYQSIVFQSQKNTELSNQVYP
jgi:glycosyltransferase involved in cell wall biosynthesis